MHWTTAHGEDADLCDIQRSSPCSQASTQLDLNEPLKTVALEVSLLAPPRYAGGLGMLSQEVVLTWVSLG